MAEDSKRAQPASSIANIRNVAIIAHVDHGKTTLVDKLLQQTGTIDTRRDSGERLMDSGELEKERGITILAKNTAITWSDYRINIVDTPGHADFGGEVERILSMVDSVLLLVDAVDGPMPQTRFVTAKAFAQGLNPIVVVNKVDRPGAEPFRVIDEVFDLFDSLGANDTQLDFPIVYASALNGQAGLDPDHMSDDMVPLLEAIVAKVPPPPVDRSGPFQMQISALDYSSYVGVIGIGRITRGEIGTNTSIVVVERDGSQRRGRVLEIQGYHGLQRVRVETASAGDIVCVSGVENIGISDTLCDPNTPEAMPPLTVDEPTMTMMFRVNTSPFAGDDGKFLTSRQISERLFREASYNVALRVETTADPDQFKVSGRGELHLSILIETMRREGFELAVSRPEVITREGPDGLEEPLEDLVADVEEAHQGGVMEALGQRRGELKELVPDGSGRVRLRYLVAARALMGFQPEFLSLTSGTGVLSHSFAGYGPWVEGAETGRSRGVLISALKGKAVGFALWNLQERGRMFVDPGQPVYEGMIVGRHTRGNDLTVNPTKEKKLTNVRASGTDDNIMLTPATKLSLEQCLEFINDDELVEITPLNLRLRKKELTEIGRKRNGRLAG